MTGPFPWRDRYNSKDDLRTRVTKNVAYAIHEYMRVHGVTMSDIARRSGLTPSAVSRWAAGTQAPGTVESVMLAAAMDYTLDYLLEGDQFR